MFCNQCEKTVCVVCLVEGKCSEHYKQVEMVSKVGVRHVDMLRQQMEELGAVQHSIAQQLARVEALMQGAWGGGILCTPSASMSCFSETVLIDAVGCLSLSSSLSLYPIPTPECTLSAQQAVQEIHGTMNALRAAISTKEQAMVGQVKQASEAKLKTLDLHKANLDTVRQCAAHMVGECRRLVDAAGSSVMEEKDKSTVSLREREELNERKIFM